MSFANQVGVITGASSGIGRSLALALAREGCKVGLVARRGPLLEALAEEIIKAGGACAHAVADVGNRSQLVEAVHGVADRLGPVDLLIANAGIGIPSDIDPFNIIDMERVLRINYFGVLYAIDAVLPDMLRRGRGHLSAVSSLGAYKALPGQQAYCASKAAVNTFLEGLRVQLRPRGIAVTTICPGFIWTPMTADHPYKMPFLLQADVAAKRILRALRRRKKVFNFPWQTSLLMKLTRWLPDWLLARLAARYIIKPPAQTGESP
jgi:short-subunit dehydrogenase